MIQYLLGKYRHEQGEKRCRAIASERTDWPSSGVCRSYRDSVSTLCLLQELPRLSLNADWLEEISYKSIHSSLTLADCGQSNSQDCSTSTVCPSLLTARYSIMIVRSGT